MGLQNNTLKAFFDRYSYTVFFDGNFYSAADFGNVTIPDNKKLTLYEWVDDTNYTSGKVTITNKKNSDESQGNSEFTYTKQIDAFRDGVENPDTDLDDNATEKEKKDLYRLYLNAKADFENKPVDFLFVIDKSKSMEKKDVILEKDGREYRRDDAVGEILNGKEGVVQAALNMNPQNEIAVISFSGKVNTTVYCSRFESDQNAVIEQVWENKTNLNGSEIVIDTKCKEHATNYEAGIRLAGKMFESVKTNGHKKVMVFLSDGVPSLFIIDQKDIDGKTQIIKDGKKLGGKPKYIKRYVQDDYLNWRWGNGSDLKENSPYCRLPSKWAFDDFKEKYPEVYTYTVGLSKDIDDTEADSNHRPEVLKYYAQEGNGKFFGANNGKELKDALTSIVETYSYKNLVIKDTLSENVDVYNDNADILVTREKGGTKEALYQDKSITSTGEKVIESVDVNGKDIEVKFKEDYEMESGWTYSLSFNVKTTQKAYDKFRKNGYNNIKGDSNTDYKENNTSSSKDGFYSNENATVSYSNCGKNEKKKYAKPVIQVDKKTCNIKVKKIWKDEEFESNRPASLEVELYCKENDSEKWKKEKVIQLNTNNNWEETCENLILESGEKSYEYKVVEKVPKGYKSKVTSSKVMDGLQTFTITNTYIPRKSVSVVKNWDDDGDKENRPESVTIELQHKKKNEWETTEKNIFNEKIDNPIILNAQNDWSYRWEALPDDGREYQVVEKNVPKGYTVSVVKDGSEGEKETKRKVPEPKEDYNVVPVTKDNVFKKTEFYKRGPFGIFGGFHLVGFNKITANTHINGNICTEEFILGDKASNFGTNKKIEISYVRKFSGEKPINAGGVDKENDNSPMDSILVIGKDAKVDYVSEYNKCWTIDGIGVYNPQNNDKKLLWQDQYDCAFIDLDKEQKLAERINLDLAKYEDTGTLTRELTDSDELNLTLKNPKDVNVINLEPKDFENAQIINVKGFPNDKVKTVILNIDAGNSDLTIPGVQIYYEDDTEAPYAETVVWQKANVLCNIHNKKKLYKKKVTGGKNGQVITGHILAPKGNVILASGLNGTVVADTITVNCESHRTDFTGKKIYPDEHFVVTNTKRNPADYTLPSTGRLFGKTLYWILGSALIFLAFGLRRKKDILDL